MVLNGTNYQPQLVSRISSPVFRFLEIPETIPSSLKLSGNNLFKINPKIIIPDKKTLLEVQTTEPNIQGNCLSH